MVVEVLTFQETVQEVTRPRDQILMACYRCLSIHMFVDSDLLNATLKCCTWWGLTCNLPLPFDHFPTSVLRFTLKFDTLSLFLLNFPTCNAFAELICFKSHELSWPFYMLFLWKQSQLQLCSIGENLCCAMTCLICSCNCKLSTFLHTWRIIWTVLLQKNGDIYCYGVDSIDIETQKVYLLVFLLHFYKCASFPLVSFVILVINF
jgi:hypothetical protein